jgi:hypothetical protein
MAMVYDRILLLKGGGAWVWKSVSGKSRKVKNIWLVRVVQVEELSEIDTIDGTDFEIRCTFDYTEVYPKAAKKDKHGSDQFQEVFAFGDFRSKFVKKVFSKSVKLPEPSDDDRSVAKQLLKWYEDLDIDALNKKMASVRAFLEHGKIHPVEHS